VPTRAPFVVGEPVAVLGLKNPEPSPEISIDIAFSEERYWINEQASMPTNVSAVPVVKGTPDQITDDLVWIWTTEIDYNPSDYSPNGPYTNISYRWPPKISEGSEPFTPDFGNVVRGGTLSLTAITHINGVVYTGRTTVPILGTNPSRSALLSYLSGQFPSSFFTLWRIGAAESGLDQFGDDGYPKWSTDGYRGVGFMQITNPAPADDEIWSWKRNADAGSDVLQRAYANARNWPGAVSRSPEFAAAVEAFNASREVAGQPKLKSVSVPDFSSGNLRCNLLERERDAVRLYNGAGGSDDMGLPLHEYKLARDPVVNLLDLAVDEQTGTGTAKWVRVDPSERPQSSGASNYVDRVLDRAPPLPC